METEIGKNKRVLIGLSGGRDSGVAAALLKTQGYNLTAVHFTYFSEANFKTLDSAGVHCVHEEAKKKATSIAASLELQIKFLNFDEEFEFSVLDSLIHDRLQLKATNPCLNCVSNMKIKALLQVARENKFDYVATGLYAQVIHESKREKVHLIQAVETELDESYFLFRLTQKELSKLLNPLGNFSKDRVLRIAKEFNLDYIEKETKTGFCFRQEENFKKIVESKVDPLLRKKGSFEDWDGLQLGVHDGIFQFKMGQKLEGRQLPKNLNQKSILDFKFRENLFLMGKREQLSCQSAILHSVTWLEAPELFQPFTCRAKLGMEGPMVGCKVYLFEDHHVRVVFNEPQFDLSLGLGVAFYQGNELVGGGFIEEYNRTDKQSLFKKKANR